MDSQNMLERSEVAAVEKHTRQHDHVGEAVEAVARRAYKGGDVCGNREAGEAEAEAVDVAPTTKSRLVSSARCSRL